LAATTAFVTLQLYHQRTNAHLLPKSKVCSAANVAYNQPTIPLFSLSPSTSAQLAPASTSDFELTQLDRRVESNSQADAKPSDAGAASEPSLQHTRREDISSPPEDEVTSIEPEMSRTPLLIRSSPAHGTGSYGVLPTHLDLSDEEDAQESSTTSNRRISKNKGKRALRHPISEQDEGNSSPCDAQEEVVNARRRRRSLPLRRKGWSSEGAVTDASEALKPSSTTTTVPTFDTGPSAIFESQHSSDEIESNDGSQNGTANGFKPDSLHMVDIPEEEVIDNSPYAEVRASVAPTDNTTLSINTPRMWTLSILFAVFGSATNLFFSLRYPSVSITPVIALLIVHPMGLLWDRVLKRSDDPDEIFENGSLTTRKYHDHAINDGEYGSTTNQTRLSPALSATSRARRNWKRRLRLWLAQGKWNEKEHCCVFISSNVSFGFAFATDVGILPTILHPLLIKRARSLLSKQNFTTRKFRFSIKFSLRSRLRY
jgi:hypothetical protein